ncbi:MAG TPA: alcohol dehydrogenase catalytic domain-containing protein [Actinomycetota bacterium]|nr:alcohol dehydrogenase catalytic domain-containing protein [Actinomycetota bacterium]
MRFLGKGKVEVVEAPAPVPGERQALVRIVTSAICGSEKHALQAGMELNAGHEGAGVIESAPKDSGFAPGDRVGISAVAGCGQCAECEAGIELRCEDLRIQINMHAELVAADVTSLRRIPDGLNWANAVLLTGDGLGVPVRALRHVPERRGRRTLVLGLGPVGLSHVLVRSFLGEEVSGVDPFEERRALAMKLGASAAFGPGEAGRTYDLVIESSGVPESIKDAFVAVCAGGTVIQSGECSSVELDPSGMLIRKEVRYIGSWFYASQDYPRMLELHESGMPSESLATDVFPGAEAQAAYDAFASGSSGKVLLNWNDDSPR